MLYSTKNFYKNQILILCCLILLAPIALAQNFDTISANGWSWYFDPIKQLPAAPRSSSAKSTDDPETRMQQLKQVMQRS